MIAASSLQPGQLRWPSWWQTLYIGLRPVAFYEHVRREHPQAAVTRIAGLAPALMVYSPELVKAVFGLPAEVYSGGAGNQVLEPIVGSTSVIVTDGNWHQRQRRLMRGAFTPERLARYSDTIAAITRQRLTPGTTGQPLSFLSLSRQMALDVIVATVFGVATESGATADAETQQLATAIGHYAELANAWPLLLPWFQQDWGPLSPWGRVLRSRAAADHLLFELIAKQRQGGLPNNSVLASLVTVQDDDGTRLSDAEIRDALVSLLVAGHETTATAMAWVVDFLAHHPCVQQQAREVVLADSQREERSAAKRWPYLDALIREALRLRPVLSNVRRLLLKPAVIGPYEVPAGHAVAACAYLSHTDPEIYADPYGFKPERWLTQRPDPAAYYPFGGGARYCLGFAFAMHEMTIMLATLLQHTDIKPGLAQPARIERRGITFSPERGARVKLEQRS